MTRWARVTTTQNKRPFPATSWEDMKKGSSEGQSQNLPKSKQLEANRLSLKNDAPQAKHKKNKKKKEYLNEDVNGFMEYLRQNSQMLHNDEVMMIWMEMQICKRGEIQARTLSVMSNTEKNLNLRGQKDCGATVCARKGRKRCLLG